MAMVRLTKPMLDAMQDCLMERLAGGIGDWMDAIGATDSAAAKSFDALERASDWIAQELKKRERKRTSR